MSKRSKDQAHPKYPLASSARHFSNRKRIDAPEPLEQRAMLSGTSFNPFLATSSHNVQRPADVNGDGRVNGLDVIILINDISTHGTHSISAGATNNAVPLVAGGFAANPTTNYKL